VRYIALRKLTYVGGDGSKYAVLPGEGVPDFESWSAAVKHAHLHSRAVADRGGLTPEIVDGRMRMTVYGKVSDAPAKEPEAVREYVQKKIYTCPHCDHPGFSIKNSLDKHIDRKHS